jgi:hypothetical protein
MPALRQSTKSADERSLEHVVGVFGAAEHADGVSHIDIAMTTDKHGKSIDLTRYDGQDERRIGAVIHIA